MSALGGSGMEALMRINETRGMTEGQALQSSALKEGTLPGKDALAQGQSEAQAEIAKTLGLERATESELGEKLGSSLEYNFHHAGEIRPMQPERIHTINEGLEGRLHPVTDIPFNRMEIPTSEGLKEGVFPDFKDASAFETQLPDNMLKASDKEHFKCCNEDLVKNIENNPELQAKFTPEQLEQIRNGDTPDGYIWHHTERPGAMQLVDRGVHESTGHTGGRNLWGGGTEMRGTYASQRHMLESP